MAEGSGVGEGQHGAGWWKWAGIVLSKRSSIMCELLYLEIESLSGFLCVLRQLVFCQRDGVAWGSWPARMVHWTVNVTFSGTVETICAANSCRRSSARICR